MYIVWKGRKNAYGSWCIFLLWHVSKYFQNNIESFDVIHAYSKSFHENACYVEVSRTVDVLYTFRDFKTSEF